MKLLAIDAGNSRIKWGLHEAGGAAAISVLMFGILVLLTVINRRFFFRSLED